MPSSYPNQLKRAIQKFIPAGSPLTADDIIAGAQGTGLDPRVLAVIARKETEFGRTSGRFKNNAFGYNVHASPGAKGPTFSSWSEGARAVASDLARNYKARGLTTLDQIVNTYAPPSENNTAQYQQQVKQWAAQLGMDPNSSVFDGAAVSLASTGDPAAPAGPAQVSDGALDPAIEGWLNSRRGGSRFRGEVMKKLLTDGDKAAEAAQSFVGTPALRQEDGVGGAAVNVAETALGVPYVWGGNSLQNGVDCSGLIQQAYAKVGIQLPRTTYDQIKVGSAVRSLKEAQPGDLLFPHAGHVMMYIGNGKAIQAPRTGDVVKISDATARTYIAIRRPTK